MSFSISSFIADANDHVVSVDWKYSNADGAITNTHVLNTPAGDFALENVTQAVLVLWLTTQLQNTTAEFDAAIADAKARMEYQAGFKRYEREDDNTYAIPAEEEEETTEENEGGAEAATY